MSGGHSIIVARIAEDAEGWRLDRALAAAVPTLSRERLKALISSGAVTGPAGMVRDPAAKAVAGAYDIAVPEPRPARSSACCVGTTPTCWPFSSMSRTSGTRMRSLMRVVSRSGGRRSNLRGIGTS